jgi:hypothetical protein
MREIVSPLDGFLSPFGRIAGSGAAPDAYAIGGASPELVAAFTLASDGTTAGEYFRKASSETTFSGLFTHSVSEKLTMFDSTGTLVWAPHNLTLYSEDATGWTVVGGSVSGNIFTENTATSQHIIYQASVEAPVVTHVLDFKTTRDWLRITSRIGGTVAAYFQLSTESVGTVSGGISNTSITHLGDGVYRATMTVTGQSANSSGLQIGPTTGDLISSYLGSGTDTFELIRYFQYRSDLGGMADNPDQTVAGLEKYVPTTSAAVYLPRRNAYYYNGSSWVKGGLRFESAAATQLLHGTDSFATQDETVTAQAYTLQFRGTGSIVLSGAHSATLTGTGANDLVSLTFTPSAGTLTLTPSGTVEYPQLEVGRIPTSYIPNTAASGTVTRAAEALSIAAANLPWPTPNVIGPELVTNGTFDTDLTGWTDNSSAGGTIAFNAGQVDLVNTTGTSRLEQDVPVTAGRVYAITVQVVALGGSTSAHLYLDGDALPAISFYILGTGTHTVYYVAPDTSLNLSARNFTTGTTVTLDNISVKEIDPLAVSIQIQGQMTYADGDNYDEIRMVRWNNVSASDRIDLKIDTYGARIGTFFAFSNIDGNSYSENTNSVGEYSPGVNVPFNVAGVFTSTEIAGAKDGATDGARSASGQRLPDLENTDLSLGNLFNGTIKLFRIWGTDIGDSGIEEVTS